MLTRTIVLTAATQAQMDAMLYAFDESEIVNNAVNEAVIANDGWPDEEHWDEMEKYGFSWDVEPEHKEATVGFRFEGPAADELFQGKFVDRALDAAGECFHNAMEPVCNEFSYVEDHDVEGEPFVEGHWLWQDGETRIWLV